MLPFMSAEKGSLTRILLRAAQHRVLDDVRHARVVLRRGGEAEGEEVLRVGAGEVENLATGGRVAEEQAVRPVLRQRAAGQHIEAADGFIGLSWRH